MPTILSRFDMIFIVKDEHDQQRDMVIISVTQRVDSFT
jgi:DNA replicative helicase MCM subunit Mcm2 (Cdc46/Mcm family)